GTNTIESSPCCVTSFDALARSACACCLVRHGGGANRKDLTQSIEMPRGDRKRPVRASHCSPSTSMTHSDGRLRDLRQGERRMRRKVLGTMLVLAAGLLVLGRPVVLRAQRLVARLAVESVTAEVMRIVGADRLGGNVDRIQLGTQWGGQ